MVESGQPQNGPLAGLRVLDISSFIAAPAAAVVLGDWGADVIKSEPPGEAKGDVVGGNRHGFDFQNLHRNKRGMTLDLKNPADLEVFWDLVDGADVVLERAKVFPTLAEAIADCQVRQTMLAEEAHKMSAEFLEEKRREVNATTVGMAAIAADVTRKGTVE